MIGVEVNPGCYALHQVQDGWEILAPSDDPTNAGVLARWCHPSAWLARGGA